MKKGLWLSMAIVVFFLIQINADINDLNENGLTSLMIESKNGNLNNVKYLLENEGANLDVQAGQKARLKRKFRKAKNFNGWTALMFAINGKHEDVSKYLIEKGANVFLGNVKGVNAYLMSDKIPDLKNFIDKSLSSSNSSIERSYSSDDLKSFREYLKKDLSGEELSSLLLNAVISQNLDKVKLILNTKDFDFDSSPLAFYKNKVKINYKDSLQNSLLIIAVMQNDKKILDALLKANANPFLMSRDGLTPREIALQTYGESDLAEALSIMEKVFIKKNNIAGKDLSFLLLKAARDNDFSLLKTILDNKKINLSLNDNLIIDSVKINAVDEQGNTALMLAVMNNNLKMVQLLLDKGANPVLKRFTDGFDAYGIAIVNNFSDIATAIANKLDSGSTSTD